MTLTSTAQHSGSTNMAAVQQRTIPAPSFRPFQPSATAPMNRPTPQSVRPLKPAVAPVASRPIASTPVAAKVPVPTTCSHLHQALATSTILLEHIRTAVKWSRKREHRALKDDQEQKINSSTCSMCSRIPTRGVLCLECGDVLCYQGSHARMHLERQRHRFFMDCRTFAIFCIACGDFAQHSITTSSVGQFQEVGEPAAIAGMKRKRVDYRPARPSQEARALIQQGARPAACEPIRGIRNLGATCFLNVVLQALLHNPLVRGYFLADRHNEASCPVATRGEGGMCMCCEVDKVFTEFYQAGASAMPYGPISFLGASWQMSRDLAGYQQQDAHEFFISTLDAMHKSSPGSREKGICPCVVHSTFAGELKSDVRCGRCGNVTTALDPLLDLNLDIRSPKMQASVPGAEQASTLFACLERFTSAERLGSSSYNCTKCNTASPDSTKQLSINQLPPVLCIQLKRFEHANGSRKIDTRVRFPLQVDMSPYTAHAVGSSRPIDEAMYDLFAVVTHEGKLDTGHYFVHVRKRETWTLINDDVVTPSSARDVLKTNPYLLFYARSTLSYAQRTQS